MFETTVKFVSPDGNFGLLENPMPGGKPIRVFSQCGVKIPHIGARVFVEREEETRRGPKAADWRRV